MSEAPETVIKEDTNKNIIQEATQEATPEINESTTQESINNEVKQEENANEEQFQNKTDRMTHKTVNCKEYGANVTLKTLRYSHKCSKLEDKEIKPKPKAKSKVKAVPIQTTQTQNEVINETPTSVKPRNIQEPQQPVIMKSPYEQIMDNYNILHQEYLNKKREKVNGLCANILSGIEN